MLPDDTGSASRRAWEAKAIRFPMSPFVCRPPPIDGRGPSAEAQLTNRRFSVWLLDRWRHSRFRSAWSLFRCKPSARQNRQDAFPSICLLHKGCGSRVRQQYLCAKEGVVVERAEMVKGYEFAKDQYVEFTPAEIKALAASSPIARSTRSVISITTAHYADGIGASEV